MNSLISDKIVFIGDIHGNTKLATKLGYRYPDLQVIQVGDFGIGFGKDNPPQLPQNVRFIRGNHDNPSVCKKSPNFLPDGSTYLTPAGKKVMFLGGAHSIDRQWRTEFVDWWPDEECSIVEMNDHITTFENFKPDIMVTHDIPREIAGAVFSDKNIHMNRTKTSDALSIMLTLHKPKLWVFGHWHDTRQAFVLGCEFRCMGIDAFDVIDCAKI